MPRKSGSASCKSDSGTPVLMSPPDKQQDATAFRRHLFADAIDQRFLRRQTIFAVVIAPEMAVMIVGVQDW